MVFGPDFPYKLGQLSSSNKISGKLKLPPSVQKNVLDVVSFPKLLGLLNNSLVAGLGKCSRMVFSFSKEA
jgi:hypothetical protein